MAERKDADSRNEDTATPSQVEAPEKQAGAGSNSAGEHALHTHKTLLLHSLVSTCNIGTMDTSTLNCDFLIPDDSVGHLPTHAAKGRLPKTNFNWDPRLILDLAIGVDSLDDILTRYDMTREDYTALASTTAFRRELAVVIRDVRENGLTFQTKAKVQAEAYLEELDNMIYAQETPASVRLSAIQSIVRWADLDGSKQVKSADPNSANNINIQINF